MKKFVRENKTYLILFITLLLVNCISTYILFKFQSNIIIILTQVITILVFGVYFLIFNRKKIVNLPLEKVFLIISIPIGILYMAFLMPGQIVDENNHFPRAYEISQGHLISSMNETGYGGRVLPIEVAEITNRSNNSYKSFYDIAKEETDEEIFIGFNNASLYSFVSYIPQSTGIFVGRLLNLPIVVQAYLARIFNFIVWLIIMYLSIKYIPFKKISLVFIALLPITIQEAVSMSPDALTIACSSAIIAYVLYLRYTKKDKMSKKNIALMYILSIVITLSKLVYFPFCLLFLLVPKNKYKNEKYRKVIMLSIVFVSLLVDLIWMSIASKFLVEVNYQVDAIMQFKHILYHPFVYITVLFKTLLITFGEQLLWLCGNSLGYVDIMVPGLYSYIFAFIMVGVFTLDKYVTNDTKKQNLINILMYGIVIILTVILIYSALYIQWTALEFSYVLGLQGRYFIPILLLISLILSNLKINTSYKLESKYLYLFMVFYHIYILNLIFSNFI